MQGVDVTVRAERDFLIFLLQVPVPVHFTFSSFPTQSSVYYCITNDEKQKARPSTLESEFRMAMFVLGQRPPRYTVRTVLGKRR